MSENESRKLDFFLQGTKDTAVLLVHGITGTPTELRYFSRGLNKAGYTVVVNSLPRHGSNLGELKKVTWQEITDACMKDFRQLKQDFRRVFVGGLSLGALVAIHLAYKFPQDVSGIIALAPTLFYDGWALQKGQIFMRIGWHIRPLRNAVDLRERWPYGLKDEETRENIARFYKDAKAGEYDKKVLLFGSPFFPVACLYQHDRLTKVVKKELTFVKTPILIMHAREDDMTSLKNAQYVFRNIASSDKTLVVLEDSYHMIPIDKEKDKVIAEAVKFLDRL
jgi:carboxylesterase